MNMTQEQINVDLFDQVKKLQVELSAAKREALELATSIQRKEFPEMTTWEPLDDVAGIVSQISNMYAGVRAQRDKARMQILKEAEDYALCYGALQAQKQLIIDTLEWYAENVENCRKVTQDGNAARSALDKDGGSKAKFALKILTAKEDGAKQEFTTTA